MDIKKMKREAKEGKVSITVVTDNLDIYIDLKKVTPTVTQMEVNAKEGSSLRTKPRRQRS